jgi:pyruvate carboxylase
MMPAPSLRSFQRVLVANRGEIAIRVFRAATELNIATIGIFAAEDRLSLHCVKADESYQVGAGRGAIQAYLDIPDILRVAREAHADAIHPGYGFLAERPDFAAACEEAGIAFIGPPASVLRLLGNKVAAREAAARANVPLVPATGALPIDPAEAARVARALGLPAMLKASWGGGGRGMRVIESFEDLEKQIAEARAEALAAFGNDEVFLERLVRRARHVEVQILGDQYGNVVHLFERDCSVQRRNQKVVERAPAPYLSGDQRKSLTDAALRLARSTGYVNAGTVEFLMDADSGEFYFIEVNPRVQVEHTVTEEVTGIDIVKAQILIAEGHAIGTAESGVPAQEQIHLDGHALQCRITTEDVRNNFLPDYGKITAYRGASGFGVRTDGGTAYAGAEVSRFYDSLLEKVTCWAPTDAEAIARMRRALTEFRIRGIATNVEFLERIVSNKAFRQGTYTTRFIEDTPELFAFPPRGDRTSKLLRYLADIAVNGHPDIGVVRTPTEPAPVPPNLAGGALEGTKQTLDRLGAAGFAQWMLEQEAVLVTDTTMRDAHQSLLATRVRSYDMLGIAPAYAELLPQLLSLECWGGATFDVAYRFLQEDPWQRLQSLRARMPNMLLQMLLRGSNAVGYTSYPDNAVRFFVRQAAAAGIDLFRIFDSLNDIESMRGSIDEVLAAGKLVEGAMCYTGDLLDPSRTKYDLNYYLRLAKQIEATGAHILAVKDMAGVCKPEAARRLVSALKQEIGLPIHFHTHDTSGIGGATLLAAVEAGVDAVDAALDSMSGFTSQPSLGALAAALRYGPRDTGLNAAAITAVSRYWEVVRRYYAAFESDPRASTSDVYRHEMPGGQYTNLRQQARALKIEDRWPEIAEAYTQVNQLFGDIVKVTPTSKVVGDMALIMVTAGITPEDILDPAKEITFPDSVVGLFRGDLGRPEGGFPPDLQRKVLKGKPPLDERPGASLPPIDLASQKEDLSAKIGHPATDYDLAGYLMYPSVFLEYAKRRDAYGDVHLLPTPAAFQPLMPGEELLVTLAPGKTIVVNLLAVGEANEDGIADVFFEVNGQPRMMQIRDRRAAKAKTALQRAEASNPAHLASPLTGIVGNVAVKQGQHVAAGELLMSIEAMKMATNIYAQRDCAISDVFVTPGIAVSAGDLVMLLE